MNALDLEVQDFVLNLFLEVAKNYSIAGVQRSVRHVDGSPVGVYGQPFAAALSSQGTLLLGSATVKEPRLGETEDATAEQAGKMILRHPVGLTPFRKGWLVTDHDHGAVFYIENGRAQVLAGFCSTNGPAYGSRNGSGRICSFGVLSGIVFDGKRYAYVVDTGNNSIRRLDLGEVSLR